MEIESQIIDKAIDFEKMVRSVEKEKVVAVDLEADSMYHYQEKVCLIQIATEKISVVIDPLAIKDLSPLKPFFSNPDIQKIFHGADYDVRSLYRDFKIRINNLFDTELASRFIGIKETGLQAVLKMFFNVNVDKKYQKKDWSKRPLPREMMAYASKDVMYLLPLARMLIDKLKKIDRMTWVLEECEDLSNVRPVLSNEAPLFMKFKGAGRLKSRSLAVLEALLQFRKRVAEKKDRPFFKIIGNESMMKITTARPVTLRRLKSTNALSGRQISMYGSDLIKVVAKTLKTPESELPVFPSKKPPVLPNGVPAKIKALKSWRASKASALGIDPGLLCNNALITVIAVKNPGDRKSLETVKEMKNWQKQVFGTEIIRVLKKTS
ncbi:MAG: HRDC domain-containing protein [Desulfobacteraceae bacterium]|jgi:ribonuclease D|nr:HRDC domain-containing protein [Desulfobacteraceae bacterium]MDH3723675.1 HRDC domain-containing protein [Desulfobacteraceae bacterium]MDH3838349.1 HRDC domain-containing protein [Desulfobacteraceae bacterium]MDH3875170.1 HRDC domain-containing protein [Desulfobacteraceae bacterium]MDH3955877.1 HRDC domain-containing protein [Desulfobacteraceae bacterium]